MEQITNYDTKTLVLFLSQYLYSEKLRGVIEACNLQANDVEQALFEIRDEYWVDVAVGAQLNVLGIIWVIGRNGLSDTLYRQKILSKIAVNQSPTVPFLISILKLLYGASYVKYVPNYPAGYYVWTDSSISLEELRVISASGVEPVLIKAPADGFTYDDALSSVADGLGYGDATDPSIGGGYAEIVL